jgi:hypothetical protein
MQLTLARNPSQHGHPGRRYREGKAARESGLEERLSKQQHVEQQFITTWRGV